MPRVAFLTTSDMSGYTADDHLALAPLAERGWTLETLPWSELDVDWSAFDAVIVRSTWDYQDHFDEFFAVLERIEGSRARLENSLDAMRWNAHKSYLLDLENRGVSIVPTLLFESKEEGGLDLDELFERLGSNDIVLKPAIGASALDTFRIQRFATRSAELIGAPKFGGPPPILAATEENRDRLSEVFSGREILAQPFLREVEETGEHSLFFFNGRFSHAVLKTPRSGDFRVQEEHGGQLTQVELPEELIVAAQDIVHTVDTQLPLYVRVDLVRRGETAFLLMELELIEPALYFRIVPGAADRFAEALVERCSSGCGGSR